VPVKSPDPRRGPRITFLMRRLQQHYARDIDTALRESGFSDIRAVQAQVIRSCHPRRSKRRRACCRGGVTKQTMAQSVTSWSEPDTWNGSRIRATRDHSCCS